MVSSSFIKYFFAAGAAVIVNILSRMFYNIFFSFDVSVIISYITGHIVNYFLSDRFVFTGEQGTTKLRNFIKFTVVASGGLLVTFIFSTMSLKILSSTFNDEYINLLKFISHIIGIGMSFIFNFIGHSLFSFKNTGIFNKIRRKK